MVLLSAQDKELLKENGRLVISLPDNLSCSTEIAYKLGTPVNIGKLPLVQKLELHDKDHEKLNTYSGSFGLDAFPLHTDLAHWDKPPRYFFLHCIIPNEDVGTTFIKTLEIQKYIPKDILDRALLIPRKKLNGRLSYLRACTEDLFRWDELFLLPANQEAHQLYSFMRKNFSALKLDEIKLLKNQLLIIDNWMTLHGRSGCTGTNTSRLLHRVYLGDLH